MHVPAASAALFAPPPAARSSARPLPTAGPAAAAATSADRATISQAARDLLAGTSAVYDTDQGPLSLDIDAYFTPPAAAGGSLTQLPPLLLPSPGNIAALSDHISARMPEFLARHGIPAPPASITYDNQGRLQLPADYPYAEEFRQALADDPALDRELRAVAALTSHLVEMRKSIPFQEEYAAATTPAAVDAVIAKYRYLFSAARDYDTIALNFSATGQLSLTADGRPALQAVGAAEAPVRRALPA